MRWLLALSLAVAVAQTAWAQASEFDVAVFRTQRGPELTVVDGVVEFEPQLVGGGADCAYMVRLVVSDSGGTEIFRDRWRGLLACDEPTETPKLDEPARRVVETFQFAIVPGSYTLAVSVEPAGKPEGAHSATFEVQSLEPNALASDLVLGRDVGWVDDTSSTGLWTVRKGEVGIAADPYVVVDPERAALSYYLEAYGQPDTPLEGVTSCVIRRPTGEELLEVTVGELSGDVEAQTIAGTLPVTGLPPGDYALELRLELSDTVVTRSRGFAMGSRLIAVQRGVRQYEETGSKAVRDYFWSLSDEELTELFEPIVVWLSSERDRQLYRALEPNGKRRYLITYFSDIAPKSIGGDDSPLDIYLERARHIRENFEEKAGGGAQSGWRTDRGHVYLLRGKPDQRTNQRFPATNSPPYEIWSYDVGPRYVYLFIDETRFGNYRLIFSTDPSDTDVPDWPERAGPAALTDLERLYGIRPQFRERG